MSIYRTHNCGVLRPTDVGQTVKLAGWINSRRDHGGLIFLDLRDRYGLTQLTFDPRESKTAFALADKARPEYVVTVAGKVTQRPAAMVNPRLKTGKVEVRVSDFKVLNKSETPPFEINDQKRAKANEDLRLKYRYLDLRHQYYQRIMARKDELFRYVRDYFHQNSFMEVQTPILANSTPEGARDYLVPSRLHPGKFYALPQAPQQYKQLLMVGGLDRYFQMAPCFRDEDPRADRHPGDFYQIDLEMSFVEREDIFQILEPLLSQLTDKFSPKKVFQKPFPRLSWDEALDRYGSDKPDLRYGLAFIDLTKIFAQTKCQIFAKALNDRGQLKALRVPSGAAFSRKDIDEFTAIAKQEGLGGLAYITFKDKPTSPILKFLASKEIKDVQTHTKAAKGDIVFFAAAAREVAAKALGKVRVAAAGKLKLADPKIVAWAWIYDFPLYSINEITGQLDFEHNPFSMPRGGGEAFQEKDPRQIRSTQFDIVANGFELGSGSLRNHRPDWLYQAFKIAGYSKTAVDAKFGHMITAMKYGAPPHGGCAPGIDRILMMLWDLQSIRDIYAFPLNGNAEDLMTGSPSAVSEKQLKELHLKLNIQQKKK